jgi:hypothetical protein
MANVTIPNLTSATTIAPSTDLMVLEQTEGTRKATLSQIFTSSATSGSGLGITSGGVYTIKSGLDSDIGDINTLLGNTSIASIGDGTVTGAVSQINSSLLHPIVEWNVANTSALFDFDLVNKMANFNLNVFGAGVGNGEIIGTLPVGLRPPALTVFGVCGVQDDGNFHWLFIQIYATGEIVVASSDYNSQIINCSYSGAFKIS